MENDCTVGFVYPLDEQIILNANQRFLQASRFMPRPIITSAQVAEMTRQAHFSENKKFVALARFWAKENSHDPSTKCGSVVVGKNGKIAGLGFNHLPGMLNFDNQVWNDRELKYPRVIHAELAALMSAGHAARGGTIYNWPLFSCSECAKAVVAAGISRIVAPQPNEARWMSQYELALEIYKAGGVKVEHFELTED